MFSLQWSNESDLVHKGRAGDPKNPQVPPRAGWDVKRKPPPRANAPPTETLIFYDDSPSPPRAEHYLTPLEAGLSG